jgi:hypothetical protein
VVTYGGGAATCGGAVTFAEREELGRRERGERGERKEMSGRERAGWGLGGWAHVIAR